MLGAAAAAVVRASIRLGRLGVPAMPYVFNVHLWPIGRVNSQRDSCLYVGRCVAARGCGRERQDCMKCMSDTLSAGSDARGPIQDAYPGGFRAVSTVRDLITDFPLNPNT